MMGVRADSDLRRQVLEELAGDARLARTELGIEVRRGVVMLSGLVETYAQKLAAREAAHRVAGVRELADDVQVRPPGGGKRTDAELADAVRAALEWDVFVPDRRIRSIVTAGRVILEGEVETAREKQDAACVVRHVKGVRGIENRIRVGKPGGPPTPRRAAEKRP